MEHGSERIGEIFDFGMLHLEWPTALFVFVMFLLTMIVLNTLLFKPILKTLEARQSALDQDRDKARNLEQTIENSEQDYHSKLAAMRESIQNSRHAAMEEALDNSRQKVTQAKTSVTQKLEMATKELEAEKKSALEQAASLTGELSQLIKSKVLA